MKRASNKTVLVTGGSAGFGLALAKAFGTTYGEVLLVARNADRLQAASEQLAAQKTKCRTFVADVTNERDVANLAAYTKEEIGRLDVLINAAGKSVRGLATSTTVEEFRTLWEINFLSAVRCTTALLPLVKQARGSIINIGSLASKTASPYMGGYPAAKHALAAYSQQLRLEMREQDVHVMLVCPGPIHRDGDRDRYNAVAKGLPESAGRPGGGARLRCLDPDALARQVVTASKRRQLELVVPRKVKWLFALAQLWPSLGDRVLRIMT